MANRHDDKGQCHVCDNGQMDVMDMVIYVGLSRCAGKAGQGHIDVTESAIHCNEGGQIETAHKKVAETAVLN